MAKGKSYTVSLPVSNDKNVLLSGTAISDSVIRTGLEMEARKKGFSKRQLVAYFINQGLKRNEKQKTAPK